MNEFLLSEETVSYSAQKTGLFLLEAEQRAGLQKPCKEAMMVAAVDVRQLTVTGARAVWREPIDEDDDLIKLIRIVQAELLAHNKISLVVIVGNPDAQVAITELD